VSSGGDKLEKNCANGRHRKRRPAYGEGAGCRQSSGTGPCIRLVGPLVVLSGAWIVLSSSDTRGDQRRDATGWYRDAAYARTER